MRRLILFFLACFCSSAFAVEYVPYTEIKWRNNQNFANEYPYSSAAAACSGYHFQSDTIVVLESRETDGGYCLLQLTNIYNHSVNTFAMMVEPHSICPADSYWDQAAMACGCNSGFVASGSYCKMPTGRCEVDKKRDFLVGIGWYRRDKYGDELASDGKRVKLAHGSGDPIQQICFDQCRYYIWPESVGSRSIKPHASGYYDGRQNQKYRLTGAECTADTELLNGAPPAPPADGWGEDGSSGDVGDGAENEDVNIPGGPLQLSPVGDIYTRKYPDGFSSVWDKHSSAWNTTGIMRVVGNMVPQSTQETGTPPTWSIDLNLGPAGDYGVKVIELPQWAWDLARAITIFSALLLARRLIFGG